jgi:hypothetical protein
MTPMYRFASLLGLVALYVVCCGDFTDAPRIYARLFLMCLFGAVTALYKQGDDLGTLHPISTRSVWIIVGVLLMGASILWTFVIRGHV